MVIATGQYSPINIDTTKNDTVDLGKVLRTKYYDTTDIIFTEGHGKEVDIHHPGINDSVFYKGREYDLAQYHMHASSEHTFDGQARAMELHMVHVINPDLAASHPNQEVVVFGVTMVVGKHNQVLQDTFFDPLATNAPIKVDTFNPKTLLPSSLDGWHYEGSLTTNHDKPNEDNVDWFVFDKPIEVSSAQLDAFVQYLKNRPLDEQHGHPDSNAHPLEPIQPWTKINDFIMGTGASEALQGTSGDDKIYGDAGWDTLQGHKGNDYLDGNAGNDQLFGGNGNDTLFGGGNFDSLTGVNNNSSTPGKGEVDLLVGSQIGLSSNQISPGSDKLILGDSKNVYYVGEGSADYAMITNFDNSGNYQDVIQLHGNANMYKLELGSNGKDTEIYLKQPGPNELIGIIEGIKPSELNLFAPNDFQYS